MKFRLSTAAWVLTLICVSLGAWLNGFTTGFDQAQKTHETALIDRNTPEWMRPDYVPPEFRK